MKSKIISVLRLKQAFEFLVFAAQERLRASREAVCVWLEYLQAAIQPPDRHPPDDRPVFWLGQDTAQGYVFLPPEPFSTKDAGPGPIKGE